MDYPIHQLHVLSFDLDLLTSDPLSPRNTRPHGKVKYKLEIASIPTKYATEKKTLKIFGKRLTIPWNFPIPVEFQNTSLSSVEPMRVVQKISEVDDIPMKSDVTVNIQVIPSH